MVRIEVPAVSCRSDLGFSLVMTVASEGVPFRQRKTGGANESRQTLSCSTDIIEFIYWITFSRTVFRDQLIRYVNILDLLCITVVVSVRFENCMRILMFVSDFNGRSLVLRFISKQKKATFG